jgi:hypothetical protein
MRRREQIVNVEIVLAGQGQRQEEKKSYKEVKHRKKKPSF